MKTFILKTFDRFKSAVGNTALIFQRELVLLLSDLGVTILLLIVPVVYPFLYSLIYYPEVVRDLPVAVVDMSQSSDSRAFIRKLNATPDLDRWGAAWKPAGFAHHPNLGGRSFISPIHSSSRSMSLCI